MDKDGCRGRLLTAPDDMQKEHESESKCNAKVSVCVLFVREKRAEQWEQKLKTRAANANAMECENA